MCRQAVALRAGQPERVSETGWSLPCYCGMLFHWKGRWRQKCAARGAHALPWGSRSRLRPSHWGSVSLALLMPETWFGTCLTLPDFQAKPCHGKWSFLLVLKFRRSRANAGRHSECSKSVRGLVGLKSTNFGIAPFLYMRFLCCVELKDEESIRWVL